MAGVRGKEGELFGIANLLRLNDSVVTNGTARPIPAPSHALIQRVTALSVSCVCRVRHHREGREAGAIGRTRGQRTHEAQLPNREAAIVRSTHRCALSGLVTVLVANATTLGLTHPRTGRVGTQKPTRVRRCGCSSTRPARRNSRPSSQMTTMTRNSSPTTSKTPPGTCPRPHTTRHTGDANAALVHLQGEDGQRV